MNLKLINTGGLVLYPDLYFVGQFLFSPSSFVGFKFLSFGVLAISSDSEIFPPISLPVVF